MPTYTIKENQTALDVVSQLYGNQDNIGTLYLSNENFDINKMQNGLEITYISPNNQTINNIINNRYLFMNRDNVVYPLYTTISLTRGVYDLSTDYSGIIDASYWEVVKTGEKEYLTADNYILRLFEDSDINIYYEIY